MGKPRFHHLDIYDVQVYAAYDRKTWKKLHKRLSFTPAKPESAGSTSFAVWKPKSPGISVPTLAFWIDLAAHRDDTSGLVNTCAHEAAHGAAMLLEHVGQPLASDEALSYLVGWLTSWLWEMTDEST